MIHAFQEACCLIIVDSRDSSSVALLYGFSLVGFADLADNATQDLRFGITSDLVSRRRLREGWVSLAGPAVLVLVFSSPSP